MFERASCVALNGGPAIGSWAMTHNHERSSAICFGVSNVRGAQFRKISPIRVMKFFCAVTLVGTFVVSYSNGRDNPTEIFSKEMTHDPEVNFDKVAEERYEKR